MDELVMLVREPGEEKWEIHEMDSHVDLNEYELGKVYTYEYMTVRASQIAGMVKDGTI